MKASMILSLGAAALVSAHTGYTTSTVYSTRVYTTTSCAATVTNCPAKPYVTTDIISLYTTVCPVEATETSPPKYPTKPATQAYPTSLPGHEESSKPASQVYPTSLPGHEESSKPAPPSYPTSAPAGPAPILSTITIKTCIPTTYTSVITVTPSGVATYAPSAPVSPPTQPSGSIPKPPTNGTLPFTGGASAKSAGGLLMAVGLFAALL